MKHSNDAPSATSLPRAPRDEVGARSTRYLVTMGIRIVCFVLMVLITPYGWYTWVFGAAAIFLPYIAVVSANVGQEARGNRREDPQGALPSSAVPPPGSGGVIRIEESAGETTATDARDDPQASERPDQSA